MRIKILLMTDNPNLDTGQGIIHRYIGRCLLSRGFNVISIGYGDSDRKIANWPVYATTNDKKHYFGESIFDQIVYKEQPHIVLTIGDTWNMQFIPNSQLRKTFQWVGYTAIDGEIHGGGIPPSWINALNDMDRIVTYTQYGKNAVLKSLKINADKISIIPHGVDINLFYPISDEERKNIRQKYNIPNNALIYLLVARNQTRKNIPEILKAWAKFKENDNHVNALLWPHMIFNDSFGNNINELIKILKIQNSLVFFKEFATAKNNSNTVDSKILNELYNICDISLLLSGEGFGFPLVESMATAKPVISLNHSACAELIGDIGELVDVDYYVTGVHSTERPYPNLDMLVEKMDKLYYDENLRRKYGQLGLQKSKKYTWDEIGMLWGKYLRNLIDPFSYNCEHLLERIS